MRVKPANLAECAHFGTTNAEAWLCKAYFVCGLLASFVFNFPKN